MNPLSNKELFCYWIREREHIRVLKEQGKEKPWSNDRVFQTTYFCNVRREHDKVTQGIRRLWESAPIMSAAVPNMIMARMVNKVESLWGMGWPWLLFYGDAWDEVMSRKGSWGGAYIVSTNGNPMPKHEYVAGLLERAFEAFTGPAHATLPGTLAGAHKALQGVSGLGSFMAAQVVADLKNTEDHPLGEAEDWFGFASHGPGSLRGLSWFHETKVTPSKFMEALVSARQWVQNRDPALVAHLCNQDLQNCFCEYDKYMRVKTNTGRSKRKYDGS